jgi:hypothetical protein
MVVNVVPFANKNKNSFKSKLFGVNVDFLKNAEEFLNCKVGVIPFIYLVLLVGTNPRKYVTRYLCCWSLMH